MNSIPPKTQLETFKEKWEFELETDRHGKSMMLRSIVQARKIVKKNIANMYHTIDNFRISSRRLATHNVTCMSFPRQWEQRTSEFSKQWPRIAPRKLAPFVKEVWIHKINRSPAARQKS
jgi:hypothetical protein